MGGTSVVYVPGGDDNLYALNALTGALIWKTNLGTPPADYLWSSPILFNGSIYEGVASFGDCPLVQGRLVQMDAATGAIQHIANMVPDGCIGGGIWTSPTVDPSDGSIYVTTGTPNGCHNPGPNSRPAIVKLRASDLTILSSWTVPASRADLRRRGLRRDPDALHRHHQRRASDRSSERSTRTACSTPGTAAIWPRGRCGSRRSPIPAAARARSSRPPGTARTSTWAAAARSSTAPSCYGNIGALDPATGAFVWRSCQQTS